MGFGRSFGFGKWGFVFKHETSVELGIKMTLHRLSITPVALEIVATLPCDICDIEAF